jgi:polyhydroxyalkanoate synthesis repressor PhaR
MMPADKAAAPAVPPEGTTDPDAAAAGTPVKIKKYANRRLYNTATSSYVTLDHLCQMVKDGTDFVVHDAKTGEDITRSVLTQIIVEEEGKGGQNLLPVSFLRQLISFYGDNLQAIVPRYLEHAMGSFARNQENMRDYMRDTFGNMFPFGNQFEEMTKQNMALFQNAMKMFTPFAFDPTKTGESTPGEAPSPAAASKPGSGGEGDLEKIKNEQEAMQRRLEELSKKKP